MIVDYSSYSISMNSQGISLAFFYYTLEADGMADETLLILFSCLYIVVLYTRNYQRPIIMIARILT